MSKVKLYALFLDGFLYGKGNYDYMNELMSDYIKTHDMYGKDSVTLKIVPLYSDEYYRIVDEMKEALQVVQ